MNWKDQAKLACMLVGIGYICIYRGAGNGHYGAVLIDDRAIHRRTPPTLWFVAETTSRRLLKIVFQIRKGVCHIITAYEPNADEVRIYEKQGA